MTRSLHIPILFALLTAVPAVAEDSWLIVDANVLTDGDPLWLSFVAGQVFPIGDAPTDPGVIADFIDSSGGRTTSVVGYAPQDRGLSLRRPVSGVGIHVIGCALQPQVVDIPRDQFDDYLRRERAEAALLLRPQADRGGDAVCETYTKFAKAIVEVHPTDADGGFATPLGHRLEIIPRSNPCHWRTDATISVEVLLDGYPWPDVAISAGHEGFEYPATVIETRTDSAGIAELRPERAGHWFVKAHLIRPANGLGRSTWESFWATLTFRVAGPVDISETVRWLRIARRELTPRLAASHERTRLVLRNLLEDVFVMPPGDRLAAVPSPAPAPRAFAPSAAR